MLDTPVRALMAGFAVLAALVVLAVLSGHMMPPDLLRIASRAFHVFSAIVWVGLIWFVNMIQLVVLYEADDAAKGAFRTWIIPRVAKHFKMAGNLTVLTGLVLLYQFGYLTSRPFGSSAWLWLGVLGGTIMLGLVHARISPAIRVMLDAAITDPDLKKAARLTVRRYARINLLLSVPVTFAMVAGAHG